MGTGQGDHFVSDTVLLTDHGPEVLTTAPRDLLVR
jgi:Xaa-Pro dipeptidase